MYKPKLMTANTLQKLYHYAWDTFYKDESQNNRMLKLFQKVVMKEKADGSYKSRRSELVTSSFGKDVFNK